MQPPLCFQLPAHPCGDPKPLWAVAELPASSPLPASPPVCFQPSPLSPSSPYGTFEVHSCSPFSSSSPPRMCLPSAPHLHFASSHSHHCGEQQRREEEEEEEEEAAHSPLSHRKSKRGADCFGFASTSPPQPSSSSPCSYASTLPPRPTSPLSPSSPRSSSSSSSSFFLSASPSLSSLSGAAELSLPSPLLLGSACVSAPPGHLLPSSSSSPPLSRRGSVFLSHRRIEHVGSIDAPPPPLTHSTASIWQTAAAVRKAEEGVAVDVRMDDIHTTSTGEDRAEMRKSRRSLTRFRSSSLQPLAHLFPHTTSALPLPLPPPPQHPLERSATCAPSHASHSSSSLPCSRRPSAYDDPLDAFASAGCGTPLSARTRALRRAPRKINWEEIRARLGGGGRGEQCRDEGEEECEEECERRLQLTEVRWLSSEHRAHTAMPALHSVGEQQGREREVDRKEKRVDRHDGCEGRAPSRSLQDWTADARAAVVETAEGSWMAGAAAPPLASTPPFEVVAAASPAPARAARSRAAPTRPPSLPRAPPSFQRCQSQGTRELSGRGSATSPCALQSGKAEQVARFKGELGRGHSSRGVHSSLACTPPLASTQPHHPSTSLCAAAAARGMEAHREELELAEAEEEEALAEQRPRRRQRQRSAEQLPSCSAAVSES